MRKLETSVENKMRSYVPAASDAVRGADVIGVIVNEYNPQVLDEVAQEGIREHLVNDHEFDQHSPDWTYVESKMAETYELQRKQIVESKEVVRNMQPDDEDEVHEKELHILKRKWPYLFMDRGLLQHHKRLTGRDLVARNEQFRVDGHISHLSHFLTTSTKTGTENLIIRLKAEKARGLLDESHMFMVVCEMLCQNFGDDFDLLFKTAEVSYNRLIIIK